MTKEDAQVRFFLESNPQVMEAEEVIKNFINEISLFPFYLFLFSLIVFAVILTPLNPNQVCLYGSSGSVVETVVDDTFCFSCIR